MTNKTEKIELLTQYQSRLSEFKHLLNSDNLTEFKLLKAEILKLLDDNQRIRFNQIEFYSERPDNSSLSGDDLPF